MNCFNFKGMMSELQYLDREGEHIIGTKWIFYNKTNKEGNVICNKARLLAQGYSQMERVDYDETFVPVACMESIKILLALACHLEVQALSNGCEDCFLEWAP